MEGRARRGRARRHHAYLVALLGIVASQPLGDLTGDPRACEAVLGLVAGGAWQVLNRRDLAQRLLPLSVVGTSVVVLWLVTDRADYDLVADGGLLYAAALVAGLVLTEAVLRRRDARHPA